MIESMKAVDGRIGRRDKAIAAGFVLLAVALTAGHPDHERGAVPATGLYVVGLPWPHTWGSGRFVGIARDAEYVAGHLVARLRAGSVRP